MVKAPLLNSFLERRDARRKFSEFLGAGATHSSADLTWIRKWLEIQAPELSLCQSWKASSLSLAVVVPSWINKYRMRLINKYRMGLYCSRKSWISWSVETVSCFFCKKRSLSRWLERNAFSGRIVWSVHHWLCGQKLKTKVCCILGLKGKSFEKTVKNGRWMNQRVQTFSVAGRVYQVVTQHRWFSVQNPKSSVHYCGCRDQVVAECRYRNGLLNNESATWHCQCCKNFKKLFVTFWYVKSSRI